MGFRWDFIKGQLPENHAYGHHALFSRYCEREPRDLKILARYLHGFDYSAFWDDDRIRSLVWSRRSVESAEELGLRNFYAIGAPIIYLDKREEEDQSISEFRKRGHGKTICIAPHSIFTDVNNIFESNHFDYYFPSLNKKNRLKYFVDSCKDQAAFDPLVLLYYKDYTEEVIKQFENFGIEVVTIGDGLYNKSDQRYFVEKTVALLESCNEVLVCDTNTTWAYAGFLKIPIKVFKQSIFDTNIKAVCRHNDGLSLSNPNFFNNLLGLENKKSPNDLLKLFCSDSQWSTFKARLRFVCEGLSTRISKRVARYQVFL